LIIQLLQRAAANAKGIPSSVPLNIIPTTIINNKEMAGECFNYNVFKQPYRMISTSDTTTGYQPKEAMDVSLQLLARSSPITSNSSSASSNKLNNEYFPSAGTMTHNTTSGMSSTEEEAVTSENVHRLWKRKYHRHAKPDTNAPLKPPSAYVMFSNDVRAELKQQNKSFTDLAKIIGDRWKNISPEEKELYEINALKAREDYLQKIEEYQTTESYKVKCSFFFFFFFFFFFLQVICY
jgi:hypothetical protein